MQVLETVHGRAEIQRSSKYLFFELCYVRYLTVLGFSVPCRGSSKCTLLPYRASARRQSPKRPSPTRADDARGNKTSAAADRSGRTADTRQRAPPDNVPDVSRVVYPL